MTFQTYLGKHKNLIFNIVRQMEAPKLDIFALFTSCILLS